MHRFRTVLFWVHLVLGTLAGVVILVMSVTGALLAFQPQILEYLERDVRQVAVPRSGARLAPAAIVAAAAVTEPEGVVTSLSQESLPGTAAAVAFNTGETVYVDPYSGRVLGHGAVRARKGFRLLTDWHRWLGASGESRAWGRTVTGASNLAFLGLALSGLVLWLPRRWARQAVRAVALPDLGVRGRARDYNWHHVAGFWMAPVLIVLTTTGVVISYPWAGNLVYRVTRSPLPASPARPAAAPVQAASRRGTHPTARPLVDLDARWAAAALQLPTWGSITVRIPPRAGGQLSFTMTDAAHWNRFARSQLIMDEATGAITRWEPYAAASRGQKLRGWMRFAHTGELAGIVGQAVAGLACVAGAVLVWTGLALAVRRFAAWRRRVRVRGPAPTAQVA